MHITAQAFVHNTATCFLFVAICSVKTVGTFPAFSDKTDHVKFFNMHNACVLFPVSELIQN